MTLEIARAARVTAAVSRVTLLMGGALAPATVVDELLGAGRPGTGDRAARADPLGRWRWGGSRACRRCGGSSMAG